MMDALYPRLLVRDFPATVDFYRGVLSSLFGVDPVKVIPEATYANWDLGGEAGLVLFARTTIAGTVGTADLPADAPAQDRSMLVFKVDDVDTALKIFTQHGAVVVTEAQDRPQWGPNLRTAHLRDPEGNLLELQSY